MGLELTEAEVRANMPEYLPAVVQVAKPLLAFFSPCSSQKWRLSLITIFLKQSSSIATVPGSGMVAPISGLSTGVAKAQVWINTIFNRHKPMMLLLTLLSDKSFFFLGKPWGETSYPLQRRWWQNWSPGESSQQRSIFYCFGEASLNYKFFAQECLSVLSPKGLQQHWVASGLATKSSKSMESTLLASPLTRCVPQEDFVIVMWPDCISSGAWPDEKGGREQHNNGCQGSALWEDPHPSQGIHLRNKHGIAFSNQLLLFAQDSSGHIGFQFKDGKITSIAVDSSAARYFFLDATLLSLSKSLALTHTWYLSRIPRIYPCKFLLAGVNFYRFNAKNWQFTVYFAVITQRIGNFLCILS